LNLIAWTAFQKQALVAGGRALGIVCVGFLLLATVQAAEDQPPAPLSNEDFQEHSDAKVRLGRLLFYDPVLSGTYRVSCATCHHHDRASSNGFPLRNKGEVDRDEAALPDLSRYQRLKPSARHAPTLFNLGHASFTVMFWDGRVAARTADDDFDTPMGDALPKGLESALAAQALFPAVTRDELVGTIETELIAKAGDDSLAIWTALAGRVADLEGYRRLFKVAYPQGDGSVSISGIANAIGAFVATEWRADGSLYDAFLRGDENALTASARRGEELFRGKAGCSECHKGALQTDNDYHAVATPLWPHTISPNAETERFADVLIGRANATGADQDRFRFKTPSLRNISATAPYGHAGSFKTLTRFLEAHLDPEPGLRQFVKDRFGDTPPLVVSALMMEVLQRNRLKPVRLSAGEKMDLLAFLEALTDPKSLSGRLGRPEEVPSNLAVE